MIFFSAQKIRLKRLAVLMVHHYCYIRKALRYVTPAYTPFYWPLIKDLCRFIPGVLFCPRFFELSCGSQT